MAAERCRKDFKPSRLGGLERGICPGMAMTGFEPAEVGVEHLKYFVEVFSRRIRNVQRQICLPVGCNNIIP